LQNTQKEAEEKIMLLEGWVPKTSVEQVNKYLEDKSVVYLENKPEEEDEPPILLKNNWFSRLFEPIGRMFMFPTYAEMDLTPFFAPFFMLFFGFCLGDAGYGVVLFLGATLYKFKAKKELKPILTLGQFLAVATVIFGILSGTIFGMNLIEEESQILDQEMKKKLFDPDEMFIFALILGAIQIVFGMIIRVFNITKQKSFFHAINTIGWLVLIFGGVSVFALKHFEYINGWTPHIYPVLGVAGILILFFNNKNPLLSFGSGLYNVYNTVTGIMGDLLSYIRLFALGLSSAILGYVFNDLALQLLNMPPVIGHLFFVILLLFGHTLNLLLASLGAFVHPMRLTFVEFYKNTGFVGGGKEYKPFKKIN